MGALLRKVRAVAPQARVVVTGYFQLIGPNSDVSALHLWTGLNGFQTDAGDAALLEELTRQSEVFRDVAHDSLRTAVQTVNAATAGEPMVAFADPAFGPEHSLFAPDRWLWSMTSDSSRFDELEVDWPLFPEDPLQDYRFSACFEADVVEDLLSCLFASVGHPNPAGAAAYANAVTAALRELGILPPSVDARGETAAP